MAFAEEFGSVFRGLETYVAILEGSLPFHAGWVG